jgi:hypothetical protein
MEEKATKHCKRIRYLKTFQRVYEHVLSLLFIEEAVNLRPQSIQVLSARPSPRFRRIIKTPNTELT